MYILCIKLRSYLSNAFSKIFSSVVLAVYKRVYSLGQGTIVQDWVDEADPTQLAPLWAGAGEEHVLDLSCVPVAHVTEQLPHDPQLAQFPSTDK